MRARQQAGRGAYLAVLAVALLGVWAALALAGCTAAQKKAGLVILDAVVATRNEAIKTVKSVDLAEQVGFQKRYDGVQANPGDDIVKAENEMLKIDADKAQNDNRVKASYDFLEAIGHACEAAKVSLMAGANLALVLAPVIATALAAERVLRDLGVKADFVKLITGGK